MLLAGDVQNDGPALPIASVDTKANDAVCTIVLRREPVYHKLHTRQGSHERRGRNVRSEDRQERPWARYQSKEAQQPIGVKRRTRHTCCEPFADAADHVGAEIANRKSRVGSQFDLHLQVDRTRPQEHDLDFVRCECPCCPSAGRKGRPSALASIQGGSGHMPKATLGLEERAVFGSPEEFGTERHLAMNDADAKEQQHRARATLIIASNSRNVVLRARVLLGSLSVRNATSKCACSLCLSAHRCHNFLDSRFRSRAVLSRE
jgi:hypothetical protein